MPSFILREFEHLKIPLESIKKATNDFARVNYIAEGGFGEVFRGEFPGSNGQVVTAVVKRFFALANNSGDADFWREISLLSEYKHENIIKLLGFYYEHTERILVYEFARNGSLGHHLGDPNLTWSRRLNICLGAARGLEYLHNPRGGQQRVLHRDIKSANILLDEYWNAKIADFGFSNYGPANQQHSILFSEPKGTLGYCDPVYVQTSSYRKESDIYSFGVVILEVLCSRLCFDQRYQENDLRRNLIGLLKICSSRQEIIDNQLIDVHLLRQMEQNSFDIVLALAHQCLELDQTRRPSMDFIISTFERAIQYQEERNAQTDKMRRFAHLRIPLESIHNATNHFAKCNLIGKGGFSKVYKGEFSSSEVPTIGAVKRWDPSSEYGDTEFLIEIMMLLENTHENLISLIGFCDEEKERILVYEYAPNQSLDSHLEKPKLTWLQCLKICLGAARGLEYLHNPKGDQRVLHCDIKSANILLDKNLNVKLADFGSSNNGPATLNRSFLITQDRGTLVYVDPAFMETKIYTRESDVYSFGVVLFEVLCSRFCIDFSCDDAHQSLLVWAKKSSKKEIQENMIDPNLWQQMEQDSFDTFVELAFQCVEREPKRRPSMDLIVTTIESAIKFQEERNVQPDNEATGKEERNAQPDKEATGKFSKKLKRASGVLLGIAVAAVLM